MQAYLVRRVLLAIVTLLLVSILSFLVIRMLPGDIVDLMVVENRYAETVDLLRIKLGLDKPIHEQYVAWMGDVLRGNLGQSLWTQRPAIQELKQTIPVSLELAGLAIVFSILMGLPIGVISAVRRDTLEDYGLRSLAIAGLAMPAFWIGTLVIVLPSIWWGWTPPIFYTPFMENPVRNLSQFLLPSFILSFFSTAAVMRMTRATMLEVLGQDYIRTARSKGLREITVISRHALKNAIIPVVTILGLQIAALLGGALVIEIVFGLPGAGRFFYQVITQRDYPMLQIMILFLASGVVLVNLAVDVTYTYLDPRVRMR